MAKQRQSVNSVRPSRDGHEYHETWTARKALQLLPPGADLNAIAVEGLSPIDQSHASAQTREIADITLYYGDCHTFKSASRTTIVQFKYSVSNKNNAFRARHAKKTIEKFSTAYKEYNTKYGHQAVRNKLSFHLITNQPIYKPLDLAIEDITHRRLSTGKISQQAAQFKAATGLHGKSLSSFAAKCKLHGSSGSLPEAQNELTNILIDWSATRDPLVMARLGNLKDLVRKKAGCAGTDQNLITRTDVLAALDIGDTEDLLPCPMALIDVGKVLVRKQLADVVSLIPNLTTPLLIHASGGVGKTVFMSSLAKKIEGDFEVVFFDCFGGGAYRSPEDARDQPRRGLTHIANTLAFRGLCDPILPGSSQEEILFSTFRRRMIQCTNTISRMASGRKLALLIDAIDNAELAAQQRKEKSFAVKLLESLGTDPIEGMKIVVSCRSERKPSVCAQYQDFKLHPFNADETASFLRARLNDVSQIEINVAQARSAGNPRVLDYLLKSGRGLLDESEINKNIELDELLQNRITEALKVARQSGHKRQDINDFLAGLAVLPLPVPLDEYADTHNIHMSAVKSFVSDLWPLLERTNHGLMFRDEPIETLIRDKYASSKASLKRVSQKLMARQDKSVYAARALPSLLHILDKGEQLFALAFDERIPASITSTVGKRNIRYARIKAATLHAAINHNYDHLVRLLVELSTVATTDQRGAGYILDHPDLAVAANDADAMRRLFETRTNWPGTRHARLVIANTLHGNFEEASRHVDKTNEWINHHILNKRTDRDGNSRQAGPERLDIAAIPFFLISQNRAENASQFLDEWQDWYAYEVCEYVFNYSHLAQSVQSHPPNQVRKFIDTLERIGPLAAALSFHKLSKLKQKELIGKLAKVCRTSTKLNVPKSYHYEQIYSLQDGLRKAAAIALPLRLHTEARTISLRAEHDRPRISSFRRTFYHESVFPFMFRIALLVATKKTALHEKDVLPKELVSICARIQKCLTGEEFRDEAKKRIAKYLRYNRNKDKKKDEPHTLIYGDGQDAKHFIDHCLEPLLELTKSLATILVASTRSVDKEFTKLLRTWKNIRKVRSFGQAEEFDRFFTMLGLDTALFVIDARNELKVTSVRRFLNTIPVNNVSVHKLVQIVAVLASRQPLHILAGEQAVKANKLIETEDDVTSRASLFASLGRAMLPASVDEASAYFLKGLEHMDAIGSGDYQFTNELLLFSSSIKGAELDEQTFHALSNICELNMGDEPEKFLWGAYGRGLSKAAGLRGLAKLSRWDDRSIISLRYTLLPSLLVLVEDAKIDPQDALALNYLANPVEYYESGTEGFAKVIRDKAGPNPKIITELIQQFEDNNPRITMGNTVATLSSLAQEALELSTDTSTYLATAHERFSKAHETLDNHTNYIKRSDDARIRKRMDAQDRQNRKKLNRIAAITDPTNKTSLMDGLKNFNHLQNIYNFKDDFFDSLRKKVPFKSRAQYILDICTLENFFFPWKLAELKNCKQNWAGSSTALDQVFKDRAIPLIRLHAGNLIDDDRFSSHKLKEISELTGVPEETLISELIKIFAQPDNAIAGAVWLAFASFICPRANDGQGQLALERLLGSDVAKLADKVTDGEWKKGLYPTSDIDTIATGLIWRMLGSAYADSRWRATHSIRCFARFGRWEIIDSLVDNFETEKADSLQAAELPFYFLHARLWLLIALSRMALDHPKEISRYKETLVSIATEKNDPHILMRHFAARTLLCCIDAGELKITPHTKRCLQFVDLSPHPRLKKEIRVSTGFHDHRPNTAPKPQFEFHLDYDFHKYNVDNLGRIFGKPCWQVADIMSEKVHRLDPKVDGMYDTGGRESGYRRDSNRMTTRYHTHGQQLGWHALFFAAGRLLKDFPVTRDAWNEEDPWGEWLSNHILSRNDGLWLSDGTDRTPLDSLAILLEPKKKDLAITGDQDKLMQLVGRNSRNSKELVVEGDWRSDDGIKISISSALVPVDKATQLARRLICEDPMGVWLPSYTRNETRTEYLSNEKKSYRPWVVTQSNEPKLDKHDPYGVVGANLRSHLAQEFASLCSLTSGDPFGRVWHDKHGKTILQAQAWKQTGDVHSEGGPRSGLRLVCSVSALKKILRKYQSDLLLLIRLERYEKEYHKTGWTHTVAVVRIDKEFNHQYFKGCTNCFYKSRY